MRSIPFGGHRKFLGGILLWIVLFSRPFSLKGEAPREEGDRKEKVKNSLVVLPALYYTPETRLAGGVVGFYAFRPRGRSESVRPSSILVTAIYTQNRQFSLKVTPDLYLKEGRYIFSGVVEISRYPNKYYGIGNETSDGAEEDYVPEQILSEFSFGARISRRGNVYAGLLFGFDHYDIVNTDPDEALASGMIPGSRGGNISRLGVFLKKDSRDNVYAPTRGLYLKCSAALHHAVFGSDFDTWRFKTDFRKYLSIRPKHILAFQAYFQALTGTVPFTHLSKFGDENTMRGYYAGRFRDRILAVVRAEYRFPLIWRFKGAAFAGAGEVAGRMGLLSLGGLKGCYGIGLRFKASSEGMNIRFDYAFGKNVSGFYVTMDEAF